MKDNYFAVILAGGKGERFWPLSTARRPKQLLSLVGDKPMLAQAVDRLEGFIPPERVLVITHADLVEATREAAPDLSPENIVGEPVGRDTAAAVALATALVRARADNPVFSILTADHVIGDLDRFRATLAACYARAESGNAFFTIGIQPAGPSTSYGYIEAGAPEPGGEDGIELFRAKRFVEKPDAETARAYLATGRYYWNSGMFVWSANAVYDGFRRHRPVLADLVDRLQPAVGQDDFLDRVGALYAPLEKISIDYALMEKAECIVMARGAFAWDDVGSWPALAHHFPADEAGNVVIGRGETLEAAGNIVVSNERLTALVGVSDLVVVQAPGVTLVCPRERSEDIKRLVHLLGARGVYGEVL